MRENNQKLHQNQSFTPISTLNKELQILGRPKAISKEKPKLTTNIERCSPFAPNYASYPSVLYMISELDRLSERRQLPVSP